MCHTFIYDINIIMRIDEIISKYNEIEFVCVNPDYLDATNLTSQIELAKHLKSMPGVIPLLQDWENGQQSLTAIYKDKQLRKKILSLADSYNIKVDLEQPVSDEYVDRAIRGEHDNQIAV